MPTRHRIAPPHRRYRKAPSHRCGGARSRKKGPKKTDPDPDAGTAPNPAVICLKGCRVWAARQKDPEIQKSGRPARRSRNHCAAAPTLTWQHQATVAAAPRTAHTYHTTVALNPKNSGQSLSARPAAADGTSARVPRVVVGPSAAARRAGRRRPRLPASAPGGCGRKRWPREDARPPFRPPPPGAKPRISLARSRSAQSASASSAPGRAGDASAAIARPKTPRARVQCTDTGPDNHKAGTPGPSAKVIIPRIRHSSQPDSQNAALRRVFRNAVRPNPASQDARQLQIAPALDT